MGVKLATGFTTGLFDNSMKMTPIRPEDKCQLPVEIYDYIYFDPATFGGPQSRGE